MVEVSHSLPQVTMLGLANADLNLVPTVNYIKEAKKKKMSFVRSNIIFFFYIH